MVAMKMAPERKMYSKLSGGFAFLVCVVLDQAFVRLKKILDPRPADHLGAHIKVSNLPVEAPGPFL